MTAEEFLKQLEKCLSGLQADERANALAYYQEYFQEAGKEHEEEAVQRLGSPQAAAQRIISEMGESGVYMPPKSAAQTSSGNIGAGRIILAITLIILLFPFWFTLFALWFSLLVTVIVLLIGFAFAAVAAPIQGIYIITEGFVGYGLYNVGAGILCLGLAMLLWKPIFQLIKWMSVGAVKLTAAGINALLGRGKNI